MARSLGRTACCPALGCVADAGLDRSPQGKGLPLVLVRICQWEGVGLESESIQSCSQERPPGLKARLRSRRWG